ncbi:prepilin-type N-terminal cleavage/methylation domain-containing protein [Thermohalobacter berrensis]|uniref:Prepilin-type N-terminal cleavage/methylation domain-containing protein n=1 Tax=Thermohalobacter berrensis TaxID=99594 RepID=A0A419TAW1_9FIRM|nr:prepilin-type N-terminal cleavage/methylation domain-containing protein [Thermohalobacter berrensis]RKD34587.1 hypothetical protein BET03_01810 [Thermohalobacter berrensis]
MINLINNKRGVTLIEILLTLTILGIIIIPLTNLFVNTVKNNKRSEDLMIATSISQKYMERILSHQVIADEGDEFTEEDYKSFKVIVKEKIEKYRNEEDKEILYEIKLTVKKNDKVILDNITGYVIEEMTD